MIIKFNHLTNSVNTPKLYMYFTGIPPPYHFYIGFTTMKQIEPGFYWYLSHDSETWIVIEIEDVDNPDIEQFVFFPGSDTSIFLSEIHGQIGEKIIH